MNKTKWLALATSEDRESLSEIFKGEGYEFAIDGFRMHIADINYDKIDMDKLPENIQKVLKFHSQEVMIIERFGINRAYLVEALLAWSDNESNEPVIIEYCYNKETGNNFIRIQNSHYDDPKQAIIMCMLLPEKETEPLPEKTQKLNENAKESESSEIDNRL